VSHGCDSPSLSQDDSLIGTVVGAYRIERLIGRGGVGAIYAGIEPTIGKSVAVKVLRHEYARDEEQRRRLVAEARAVNDIRHRGIVDIFAMGELPDGRRYLVMEMLEGEPLDRYLERRGRLGWQEAVSLIDELLAVLAAAHQAGVLHRDLRPSNLFRVTPPHGEPFLKVLDFGLAKRGFGVNTLQSYAAMVGTPSYMAPELAKGEAVDARTDLYAVGCLLFEMLTGSPPYRAPTVIEVVQLHLSAPVPRPSTVVPELPCGLDALVARLLSKDREGRPPSALALRDELASLTRSETSPRQPPRQKPLGGRAALVAGMTASGALTLASGAWFGAPRSWSSARVDGETAAPQLDAATAVVAAQPADAGAAEGTDATDGGAFSVSRDTAPATPPKASPPKPESTPLRRPPAPLPPGVLKVHVFPWADIYVDGELREKGGMDLTVELRPGRHHLRLLHSSLPEYEEWIDITSGERLEKRVRLAVP